MPDDFIPYAWKEKVVLSAANTNSLTAKEMIFTNEGTYKKLTEEKKLIATMNFSEQMDMFDFIGATP